MIKTENNFSEQSRQPSAEHKRLDILVGKWKTEGEVLTSPETPPVKLIAADTYE